uniref:ATPase subunit 8 n=1 Tax=Paramoeba aparasomata TaxID=2583407 RepID=A0A5P8HBK4_9EUKA|nr:ATPase subunit 8 [Paramoeba aparasomata]
MPQLDLGIYFIQIFTNFFFFWFLYFYIKFFILGKLSNIIKIKNLIHFNNNYTYSANSIFYNQSELNYYKSNVWNNFHNFGIIVLIFQLKNLKVFNSLSLNNIFLYINGFLTKIKFISLTQLEKVNILI